MKNLIAVLLLIPTLTFAQEDSNKISTRLNSDQLNTTLDSVQIDLNSGLSYIVYEKQLNNHLRLGAGIGKANMDVSYYEGGQLSNGSYFRENSRLEGQTIKLAARYFTSDSTNAKSGFNLKLDLGYIQGNRIYNFNRFDADPGFIIIGDGKRLQESGETTEKFSTLLVGPSLNYQWAFEMQGNIPYFALNLGAGFNTFTNTTEFKYLKKSTNTSENEKISSTGFINLSGSLLF